MAVLQDMQQALDAIDEFGPAYTTFSAINDAELDAIAELDENAARQITQLKDDADEAFNVLGPNVKKMVLLLEDLVEKEDSYHD
jgi:hypothetical protein